MLAISINRSWVWCIKDNFVVYGWRLVMQVTYFIVPASALTKRGGRNPSFWNLGTEFKRKNRVQSYRKRQQNNWQHSTTHSIRTQGQPRTTAVKCEFEGLGRRSLWSPKWLHGSSEILMLGGWSFLPSPLMWIRGTWTAEERVRSEWWQDMLAKRNSPSPDAYPWAESSTSCLAFRSPA